MINTTIKEMQNIVSLILKQKKLGRSLLGLMCQVSALHHTATIIQFPNNEKAGKWELEKHIIGKQFECRKMLRFAHAQLWFVLAFPAHINWSNKIQKNKLWGLKEECLKSQLWNNITHRKKCPLDFSLQDKRFKWCCK